MVARPKDDASGKRAQTAPPTDAPTKKRRRYEEKPARASRRVERRELMAEAKVKWEQLRAKATTKQKASKLVEELLGLLRGRILEFVFRHDGSRIVQWMLAEGKEAQKRIVMDELMGDLQQVPEGELPFFVRLSCDRYGHHLAFKMLRVSDKRNKTIIFERYLRGNAAHLIRNAHGADVLDHAYQTILNARQRSELVVELLYSRERKLLDPIRKKLFDDGTQRTSTGAPTSVFGQSLELVGETFRDVVVESAASTLSQVLDKENLLRFEVVHAAVKEYMTVVMLSENTQQAIDMAVQLAPLLVHFAHTKAGIFVAVNCVKVLDAKHRKKVVRGLKMHIRKLLMDEYGHRLVIGLFEWVDDTRLVGKTVWTEIASDSKLGAEIEGVTDNVKTKRGGRSKAEKKGKEKGTGRESKSEGGGNMEDEKMDIGYMRDLCMDQYGRAVVLSLLVGRDTRYLNPDVYKVVWESLDEEKFGKTSKKDGEVRREELLGMLSGGIRAVMRKEMMALLQNHWSAGVVVGASQAEETREAVMEGIGGCLEKEEDMEKVVGSKCGRKTVGTVIKVGGQAMARGVVERCGVGVVGQLATRADGATIAERLAECSGWNEAKKALERGEAVKGVGGEGSLRRS